MTLFSSEKRFTFRNNHYVIFALICFTLVLLAYPIESTVVPAWRLRVSDIYEMPCPNMRVTQSWAHYSLYLDGDFHSEHLRTDVSGFVEFPVRTTRASLLRRVVVPVIAYLKLLAHGSVGASGTVWASGIREQVWLNYIEGQPLPDKMRVLKCISGEE